MTTIDTNSARVYGANAMEGLGASRESRGASAVEAPQPDLTGPDPAHTAAPLETIGAMNAMQQAFESALASGDPATLMCALAARMQQTSDSAGLAGVRANDAQREVHVRRQVEAYRKAQDDRKSAATWGVLAKVGAYVAAAVSVAVGVCGAMYTGGVSLAGGIALAVLCVSAAATTALMMSQDLHAWGSGQPPKWLSIGVACLALVATICSGGSGAGSALAVIASVGTTASVAVQSATIAVDIAVETKAIKEPPREVRLALGIGNAVGGLLGGIGGAGGGGGGGGAGSAVESVATAATASGQAVAGAAQAAGEGAATVYGFSSEMHTQDAHRESRLMQRIADANEDLIDGMREAGRSMQRARQRASEIVASETRARSAINSNLGRA